MFTGNGSLSIKRSSAAQGTQTAVGYADTKFAHKAAAGDTSINILSLTLPPELSQNGFTNPTAAVLASAQLLFNRKNLVLWSSFRGVMQDYYQYTVSSSGLLTFIGFTAEEGEIFEGTIRNNPTSGVQVVAALQPPATGTLAAGTTDFNVGFPFQTGLNISTQVGAVTVYRNGQLMVRNTANATASVSADGDYQEVDAGSGLGQLIRFNRVNPSGIDAIVVIPNGRLAEMPTGAMTAVIETIQGQLNTMSTYVAAMAGVSTSSVLGGAATSVALQQFGNTVISLQQNVISLQQNAALINQTNTFTAYQNIPGRTDGSSVPTGYVGNYQTLAGNLASTNQLLNTVVPLLNVTLNPGIYIIFYDCDTAAFNTAGSGGPPWVTLGLSLNNTGFSVSSKSQAFPLFASATNSYPAAYIGSFEPYIVTATTTVYLNVNTMANSGTTAQWIRYNDFRLIPVRIG